MFSNDPGAAGIANPQLRERVSDAVSKFECCLDEAIARPAPNTIDGLREAADRLMRAGARVLIELERRSGPTC